MNGMACIASQQVMVKDSRMMMMVMDCCCQGISCSEVTKFTSGVTGHREHQRKEREDSIKE